MAPKASLDVMRKKIEKEKLRARILELHREGLLSIAGIGAHPDVQRPKSTVASIIKTFGGRATTEESPRSGRPTEVSRRCIFNVLQPHLDVFSCISDTKTN